jgi:hypothetical protein
LSPKIIEKMCKYKFSLKKILFNEDTNYESLVPAGVRTVLYQEEGLIGNFMKVDHRSGSQKQFQIHNTILKK